MLDSGDTILISNFDHNKIRKQLFDKSHATAIEYKVLDTTTKLLHLGMARPKKINLINRFFGLGTRNAVWGG